MKIALVTGIAPCLYDDLHAVDDLIGIEYCDILAVGMDAVDKFDYPIKYLVSYHVETDLDEANSRRKKKIGHVDYQVVGHVLKAQYKKGVKLPLADFVMPYEPPSGSSALLACFFAIQQGYDKIVLCGCPLMGANKNDISYSGFQTGWTKHKDVVLYKVKSMSGWTAEFLGKPTPEWRNGGMDQ